MNKAKKTQTKDGRALFFLKEENIKQLLIRAAIFTAIFFGTYLFIFLYFRHTDFFLQNLRISQIFYADWLTGLRKTDFLNATLFALVGLIIYSRSEIKDIPLFKRNTKKTVVWGALSIIILLAHYAFKFIIHSNQGGLAGFATPIALAKYIFNLGFIISLFIAVFTPDFSRYLIKNYWKRTLIFVGIGIAYFFLIQFFQLIWYELSYIVSQSIRFLLNLSFDQVFFKAGSLTSGPRLGAAGFNVGISKECSGIDSLLLFISLYSLLLVLDWKRMHIKRMLLLLIPGIIGTVLYNILRIYSLIMVGIYIDPEFAIDVFHTNIGWILFLVFFMVFWHFSSKWIYKRKPNIQGKTKQKGSVPPKTPKRSKGGKKTSTKNEQR